MTEPSDHWNASYTARRAHDALTWFSSALQAPCPSR